MSNISSYATSSGILDNFNKFKVNWVKHRYIFPDQAAATTNTGYPIRIGVNHGDKYRINFEASASTGNKEVIEDTPQMIERPGWKFYNIKRMNNFAIKYVPRITAIDEALATTK